MQQSPCDIHYTQPVQTQSHPTIIIPIDIFFTLFRLGVCFTARTIISFIYKRPCGITRRPLPLSRTQPVRHQLHVLWTPEMTYGANWLNLHPSTRDRRRTFVNWSNWLIEVYNIHGIFYNSVSMPFELVLKRYLDHVSYTVESIYHAFKGWKLNETHFYVSSITTWVFWLSGIFL